jgi:beta-glucosidase
VRFRLGMFDPQERVPYAKIAASEVETPAHRALALDAAREAMTLLKNARVGARPMLPLVAARGKTIALIGPMADSGAALYGVYSGRASANVSLRAGIARRAEAAGMTVRAIAGSDIEGSDTTQVAAAVEVAKAADVIVLAVGMPASPAEGRDHAGIGLPAGQEALVERVVAVGKPVVVLMVAGGAVAMPWVARVPAILLAWYPGEEGGTAVADVLFGDYDPAGRLPVTFYKSVDDLPPYESYDMRQAPGRTYRYFTGVPLYPFGYGLSYTTFRYDSLRVAKSPVVAGDSVRLSVTVTNTGTRAGDAIVEVYVAKTTPVDARAGGRPTRPIRWLAAFRRVPLKAGARARVTLTLRPAALATVTEDGKRVVSDGQFAIAVGGGQPGVGNRYASSAMGVTQVVRVTGAAVEVR